MFGGDLDDAQAWVDGWSASVAERAEQARRMATRVAGLSATAIGGDGLVEVRVGSSGVVTGLHLDERIAGWPADRIEREILSTMHHAQVALIEQVTVAVADTVGMDTDTGRVVIAGYAERFRELAPEDDRDRRDR